MSANRARSSSTRRPTRSPSQDSESSGASREVRCACQFFMSDALLPDRVNPVGTQPIVRYSGQISPVLVRANETQKRYSDHEYEPINAPQENTEKPLVVSEPELTQIIDTAHIAHIDDEDDASSTTSAERKFLRIPLDDELVVPEDGNTEDEAMTAEGISIDERFLNATPTTTESRTDCELNTSQVDSSALEDLPLHRGSRKRATLATAENTRGQNFQQRVKTSASKLKTKLKGIRKARERKVTDRPLKERTPKEDKKPKSERPSLLDRARNIERPKFSMPKMPERPKISMPKMPDISMPKLPDRRKISLPKMPDINFPSISRQKPETKVESSIEESTTMDKSTQNKKNTRDDSIATENASKKKKFDFDFRTYPKILSRNKKAKPENSEGDTSDQPESKSTFFASLPDWVTIPRRKSKKESSKTEEKLNGKESIQNNCDQSEDLNTQLSLQRTESEEHNGSSEDSDDEDAGPIDDILLYYAPTVEDKAMMMQKSALDRSINFQEINDSLLGTNLTKNSNIVPAVETQSQQKSQAPTQPIQQKVDTPKIVSNHSVQKEIVSPTEPIFKTPFDDDDDDELPDSTNKVVSGESLEPDSVHDERSCASSGRGGVIEEINADEFFVREKGISQDNIDVSLYLSSEIRDAFQTPVNALSQMIENGRGYYEYNTPIDDEYPPAENSPVFERCIIPPVKTLRKKKGKKNIPDEAELNEYNMKQSHQSYEPEESNVEAYHVQTTQDENRQMDSYNTFPPARPSRSRKNSMASKKTYDSQSLHDDKEIRDDGKPEIPLRRKKSLTSFKSLNVTDNLLRRNDQTISLQEIRSSEYQKAEQQLDHPVAPKRRFRSRSTIHTINDDDRTSHGADSLVSEDRLLEFSPVHISENSLPGYAKIDKANIHRNNMDSRKIQTPPPTQPPPRRKRKKRETQFFTVPRKLKEGSPPVRPLRNYSTLQTRRTHDRSIPSISSQDKENISDTQYIEIEDDENSRNLQSGAVIEKMKTRPLPAPPRPPRKTRGSDLGGSTEDVLKEIHPENIIEPQRLRPEDKTDISKTSNESIVKGTLLIGNQVNIITEITPGVCVQDENLEEFEEQIPVPETIIELELTPLTETSLKQSDTQSKTSDTAGEQRNGLQKLTTEIFRTTITSQNSFPENDAVVEVEMSTQTDPLPDDFCCEEVVQEPTDIILAPTRRRRASRDAATKELKPDQKGIFEEHKIAEVKHDLLPTNAEEIAIARLGEPETEQRFEKVQDYLDHLPTIIPQLSTEEPDGPTSERKLEQQRSFSSEIPSEAQDLPLIRQGILEQQSQDRSETSAPHYDEELTESLVRFARAQQSSILGRPHELQPSQQPQSIQEPQSTLALPETLRVERLQVGDLDVDRLTVSELLAQKILVSEIDGMTLKLNDITAASGSLTTDEIKLPPNFIEDIINRIQSLRLSDESEASTSEPKTVIEKHITYVKEESTNTDEKLPTEGTYTETPSANLQPVTPSQILAQGIPYPHIYVLPPSFYQQGTPIESIPVQSSLVVPSTSQSQSERVNQMDEAMSLPVEPPEPSIPDLSSQLLRACHSSASRSVRQIILEITSRLNSGDEKQDAKTAIIIIVVLLAGLILLGFGSRGESVHHHHWEYFNPPNGDRPL